MSRNNSSSSSSSGVFDEVILEQTKVMTGALAVCQKLIELEIARVNQQQQQPQPSPSDSRVLAMGDKIDALQGEVNELRERAQHDADTIKQMGDELAESRAAYDKLKLETTTTNPNRETTVEHYCGKAYCRGKHTGEVVGGYNVVVITTRERVQIGSDDGKMVDVSILNWTHACKDCRRRDIPADKCTHRVPAPQHIPVVAVAKKEQAAPPPALNLSVLKDVTRFEGKYFVYMMTHPLKDTELNTYIGYSVDPLQCVFFRNIIPRDRNIRGAAPHWFVHMVLGPCNSMDDAYNVCDHWRTGARGREARDHRGRQMARLYDLPLYVADAVPVEQPKKEEPVKETAPTATVTTNNTNTTKPVETGTEETRFALLSRHVDQMMNVYLERATHRPRSGVTRCTHPLCCRARQLAARHDELNAVLYGFGKEDEETEKVD